MPAVQFFNFLKSISTKKEGMLFNVLYGFNEFLGEEVIKAFCENFLEDRSDFNYRRYYFDTEENSNWEEIIQEARSANFFLQARKIIVVTIRDEKKITLNKGDRQLVDNYLAKPNPNTILIIYISLNLMRDEYKLVKRGKIDKLLKDLNSPNCYTVDLDKIYEKDVTARIKDYLNTRGISITRNALDRIIEIKGDDFISILFQLSKIEISAGKGRELDTEDINEIITGIEAHSIWDLIDAIEAEDAAKYLKVLKYLFINGIKPTLIIGTLITHYNKIFTAQFLLKHNFSTADIGKVLSQPSFILNKFISSVKRFSAKRLSHILDIVYKLDFESKTSGEQSAQLSLQNFIFQIKQVPAG